MLILRLLVGVQFCLTPVTAVIAVGWTMRAMRRVAVRRWHQRFESSQSFRDFARASPDTAALAAWAAFAALVYGTQFLDYLWFAWLSHPLIHLPWARHIPI